MGLESQLIDDENEFDLILGLFIGLGLGFLAAIFFAPKSGEALQEDVQELVNHLPDKLENYWGRSKVKYHKLVDQTKDTLERRLENRNYQKHAKRLASAKQREQMESGVYEF